MSAATSSRSSLKGKIALITGASSGIGATTAEYLCREHPDLGGIALHYNSNKAGAEGVSSKCKAVAPSIRAQVFQANMLVEAQVEGLYNDVVKAFGQVDLLFINAGNNAGVHLGPGGDISQLSVDAFRKTWEANTLAPFILTKLALPPMAERGFGRLVYNSSVAALTGGVVGPHYASSKSALHGMLRWAATRYASQGVTVNAVAPALVEATGMMPSDMPQPQREKLQANIPVGRLGFPEEQAAVVVLMFANGYITNKVWAVDGGWTMQ